MKGNPSCYVSRGGIKLEKALKEFRLNVSGKICMDVGASTGGFTDCLLRHGAGKVYCVDVGYGQLAWSLRKNPHVVVLERENIRYLAAEKIPEPVAFCVADVSFISLELVFPNLQRFLAPDALVLALVKPQFEVGRGHVGKGGIVKDPERHEAATEKIRKAGLAEGWRFLAATPSPILGAKGNREFFLLFGAAPKDVTME